MKRRKEAAVVAAACLACCAVPVVTAAGIALAPLGVVFGGVAAGAAGIVAVRQRRQRAGESGPR